MMLDISQFERGLHSAANKLVELAVKQQLQMLEEARKKMGPDGVGIKIVPLATPKREGDKLTVADITYPSPEIAKKFIAMVTKKKGYTSLGPRAISTRDGSHLTNRRQNGSSANSRPNCDRLI